MTKERRAELVKARRDRGLCLYCYEQAIAGYTVCEYHLELRRAYARKWKNKQAVKSRPAASVKTNFEPDVYVETPENRWVTTFSTDCPTVWTIAEEQI